MGSLVVPDVAAVLSPPAPNAVSSVNPDLPQGRGFFLWELPTGEKHRSELFGSELKFRLGKAFPKKMQTRHPCTVCCHDRSQ